MDPTARTRPRLSVPEIRTRYMCEGAEGIGTLEQVSRAGFFVQTDDLPRPGAVIALQFSTSDGSLLDLRGEVRWNTRGLAKPSVPNGFGVVLRDPPPDYRKFFLWVVARIEEQKRAEAGDF